MREKLDQIIFKYGLSELFSSQDSKYFLATATKITLIPTFCFGLVFYSLWAIMEMNFNFFVANGFASGPEFKDAFYDRIFLNVSTYGVYFALMTVGIFLGGLLVSYFALRPFEDIEDHTYEMTDDFEQEFEVTGLNKGKMIYQSARIFFKYIQIYLRNGSRPKINLPKNMENLNSPSLDRVFLIQYAFIIGIISLITNLLLYTFTNDLYQEIVAGGLELLQSNGVVTSFLEAQNSILFNVYMIAITANILGYILISKSIIRSVDGVSFGFARDMMRVVKGEHNVRLRPRFTDPGKGLAAIVNEFLDDIFDEDASASSPEVEQKVDSAESHPGVLKLVQDAQPQDAEELPPAFIEQKMTANGEKLYHITTPQGYKVENLNESLVLKLVQEIEHKK